MRTSSDLQLWSWAGIRLNLHQFKRAQRPVGNIPADRKAAPGVPEPLQL